MLKRWLHIFLSIYIITLTILPCVDDGHSDTCEQTVATAAVPGQEHQDIDHCSPFCDCCCCGIPMMTGLSHFSIQINAIAVERLEFYLSNLAFNYCDSPWNPPKQA